MSDRTSQHLEGIRRVARWVALTVAVVALLGATGYLVRTRAFLGPVVRAELRTWAERRGASVEVSDLRPAGLTGVALEDVRIETTIRGRPASAHFETLEVRPNWWAAAGGELAVGEVRAADGGVTVDIRGGDSTPERGDGAGEGETGEAVSSAAKHSADADRVGREVVVTLEDVDVAVRDDALPDSNPVEVRHAVLGVRRRGGAPSLVHAGGYGRLPDDVSFTISTREGGSEEPPRFLFRPARRFSVDQLTAGEWPVGIRAGRATLCLEYERQRLCTHDISASAGTHRLRAAKACLSRGRDGVRASLPEISWTRSERRMPIRFGDVAVRVDPGLDSGDASVRVFDGREGRMDLSLDWSSDDDVAELAVDAETFRTGDLWPALGLGTTLRGGRLEGELAVRFDAIAELVEIRGDVGFDDAIVDHPFLDRRPVEIDASRVSLDVLADPTFEHVTLLETEVTVGDLSPARLTGSFIEAGKGWSFAVRGTAKGVSAPELVDALPQAIASPADGARLKGEFRASASVAGHTAYPRSLRLDIGFGGDVEVLEESPRVDVPSLAVTGPPGPSIPEKSIGRVPLSKWVLVDQLPDELSEALLAAEDTRFRSHSGFDWRGVRNAVAHNLEVGRLERGGSTISQQVAKNLFFTHRRTLARKIREMWATWRLEAELSKRRILELYLNTAEWGPGVQGIHEAAQFYFGRLPEELSLSQMVLLSAIIPGPSLYGSAVHAGTLPSSRVEKVEHILSNLRYTGVIDGGEYERIYEGAKEGRIGGLELTVCRDDEHAPPSAPTCGFVHHG